MVKVAHGKENTSPKAGIKNPNQKVKNAAHARVVSTKRVVLRKEPVRKSRRILKLDPETEIPSASEEEQDKKEDAPTNEDSPAIDASSSSKEAQDEEEDTLTEEEDTLTEEELAELFTYTEEEKLLLSAITLAPWMQTTLEDVPSCKVSVEDLIKASRIKSTCEGTTEVPEEFQIRVMSPNMAFSDATITSTPTFIAATFDDSSEDSDEDFE